MNFIKKYYPMVVSVLLMVFFGILFSGNIYILESNTFFMWCFLIVELILIIGVWIEIIVFMIHAAKNKELKNNVLWAVLIYFLNVFIIPYYNLKYVVKEKKITSKMILFVVLLILSLFGGLFVSGVFRRNSENELKVLYAEGYDGYVQIELRGRFVERNLSDYDLYASDYYRDINIGAHIYDKEEFSAMEIQEAMVDTIQNIRKNVSKISTTSFDIKDKNIIIESFYGENDNERFVYRISTIEFRDSDNIVNVIQVCFDEDYEAYKEELDLILYNIKIIDEVS